MTENTSDIDNNDFINPIDEDSITETPHSLTYGHHRGSFPVVPTEQGQIKSKALSSMEHQTDIQMLQIKQQMELLAQQAAKIQKRVDVSKQIYSAELRFEPLINHIYHLYRKEDDKFLLSIIGPNDWGRRTCPYIFIATVRLLADHTWDVISEGA
jgi:hypothetical protein